MPSRPASPPSPPGPVLRGVLVVGLLVTAALGVEARSGLDWDGLADTGSVRWARLVIGLLLLVGLGLLLRHLVRRPRRARRPSDDGPPTAREESEGVPLVVKLLAAVLLLGMLGLLWWLQDQVLPGFEPTYREPELGRQDENAGEEAIGARPSQSWVPVLVVGLILLAVALASRLAARRAARSADAGPGGSGREDDQAEVLSTAVTAARAGLGSERDARSAIVAAYRAMAGSLGQGLGGRARRSDTPTELLERAVRTGLVRPGPAAELTELFREARFSRHPMGEPQRRAAEAALTAVLTELGTRA